jgi:hypothetical protein
MLAGSLSLGVCAGETAPAAQNVELAQRAASYDAPRHVVEGGDFKIASLQSDRLLETYRLTKYDVIDIQVVGFPEGAGMSDLMIGPDGYVQLPYAGSVKLAGLTLDEAKEVLMEKLGVYLRFPDLSLIMRAYGPRKLYVMGEVASPGIHELGADSLNAYAALSAAGGVTRHGRSTQVQVLRVVGDTMYYKRLNIKDYIKKHDLTQNVALQDGDIIYVPRSNGIKIDELLPYVNAWAMYKALVD